MVTFCQAKNTFENMACNQMKGSRKCIHLGRDGLRNVLEMTQQFVGMLIKRHCAVFIKIPGIELTEFRVVCHVFTYIRTAPHPEPHPLQLIISLCGVSGSVVCGETKIRVKNVH